jgi:hypothetical protein
MGIGLGARRNHVAGAKEVVRCGDIVAGLIPVVGQAQQGQVREVDAHEQQREDEPERQRAVKLCRLFGKFVHESPKLLLVDWTLGHDRGPWFERDGAKGVLILQQVLLQ